MIVVISQNPISGMKTENNRQIGKRCCQQRNDALIMDDLPISSRWICQSGVVSDVRITLRSLICNPCVAGLSFWAPLTRALLLPTYLNVLRKRIRKHSLFWVVLTNIIIVLTNIILWKSFWLLEQLSHPLIMRRKRLGVCTHLRSFFFSKVVRIFLSFSVTPARIVQKTNE